MRKPRVLFVSQEISPYIDDSNIGKITRMLPQIIQERGKEIRVFMPKYGVINERRHQLHEVIRLSGMNIVIDDTDYSLIIKVASIQVARMQVYFIDNEDFFKRKAVLTDKTTGKFLDDNDERIIFFNRGVIETVKKLGWSPDIIHCHGWFTALVPLYIKKSFADNPLFSDSKIVFTLYDEQFTKSLNKKMIEKMVTEGVGINDLKHLQDPSYINLMKLAIDYADSIAFGSENIDTELVNYAKKSGKPILKYAPQPIDTDAYNEFYDEVLEKSNVLIN